MEIILAIVVATAVIFFGALISIGNERQRKAIDELREQILLWATQDITLRQHNVANNIQISNPQKWICENILMAHGYDINPESIEIFNDPQAILFHSISGDFKVIISPLSPKDSQKIRRQKFTRLSMSKIDNPLLNLPKQASVLEISALKSRELFTLGLPTAWMALTGHNIHLSNRFWIYTYK